MFGSSHFLELLPHTSQRQALLFDQSANSLYLFRCIGGEPSLVAIGASGSKKVAKFGFPVSQG